MDSVSGLFSFLWGADDDEKTCDPDESQYFMDSKIFKKPKTPSPPPVIIYPQEILSPPPLLRRKSSTNVIIVPEESDDEDEGEAGLLCRPSSSAKLSTCSDTSRVSLMDMFGRHNPRPSRRKLRSERSLSVLSQTPSLYQSQASATSSEELQLRRSTNIFMVPESDSEEEDAPRTSERRQTKRTTSMMEQESVQDSAGHLLAQQRKRMKQKQFCSDKMKHMARFFSVQESKEADALETHFSNARKEFLKSLRAMHAEMSRDIGRSGKELGRQLVAHGKKQEDFLRDHEKQQAALKKLQDERARTLAREKQLAEEKRKREKEKDRAAEAKRLAAEQERLAAEKERRAAERAEEERRKSIQAAKKMGAVRKWTARVECAQKAQKAAEAWKLANKKDAMQIRITIGRLVNQITATRDQIQKCVSGLRDVLASATRENEAFVSFTVAETLLKSSQKKISLNQKLAYCYGYVLCGVALNNTAFTKVALSVLSERCPFVVPFFPRRDLCDSAAEHLGQMRRAPAGEDEEHEVLDGARWEAEPQYYERMSGYLGLYAGFIDIEVAGHPKPNEGKKWIQRVCRILEYPTFPPSLAPCLSVFLSIASYSLFQRFPEEFSKLLTHLMESILKFPADRPIRKQYIRNIELILEEAKAELQLTGTLKEPPDRILKADVLVNASMINWDG